MLLKFHLDFFMPLLFVRTATALILVTPGDDVMEGSWAEYSCTFPCTHSLIAWRVGEDFVIDSTRLSLQGFDRVLEQMGITEAVMDTTSSCSDSNETGSERLRLRVTTRLDSMPIQCEALPRDNTPGSSNLYSVFSILHVQAKETTDGTILSTSTALFVYKQPSPTPASSSTCVCTPSYTPRTTSTVTVRAVPSVSITPSPALCPNTTPEIQFITRVVTKRLYIGPSAGSDKQPILTETNQPSSSRPTSGVSITITCNCTPSLLILILSLIAFLVGPALL